MTYHDIDIDPVELPFGIGEIDYTDYSNRQLAAVPLAVLAVALAVLVVFSVAVAPTGVPVLLGIDFTGGTDLTVATSDSRAGVQDTFPEATEIRGVQGEDLWILTFTPEATDEAGGTDDLVDRAEGAGYEVEGVQDKSAAFGQQSQTQALFGVGLAFLGMSAVVFVLFRTFVPSIAVVVSAFSDIVIPLAMMNLLGIDLSLGTVAALLMLIGYSVDSDILLNNSVLRRRGGFYESAYRAMRTGVTMTLTSIAAMSVMTVVATLFQIPLLPQIGLVLVIGLCADLLNTYMLNLSLLRWYKYEGVNR